MGGVADPGKPVGVRLRHDRRSRRNHPAHLDQLPPRLGLAVPTPGARHPSGEHPAGDSDSPENKQSREKVTVRVRHLVMDEQTEKEDEDRSKGAHRCSSTIHPRPHSLSSI